GFCFYQSTSHRHHTYKDSPSGLQYMAILHFSVTLLKAFELGSALFWCPEKATLSKLFSHDSIQFALPMTGLKCFIKPSLTKDIKKSLCFFIAPMHTCHSRISLKI
uniref:Uncharacterized protein n=1 Tax=Peromyscus maniculatus bairdii TaxID=230844 RepID=A0A8C8U9I0_PERMB